MRPKPKNPARRVQAVFLARNARRLPADASPEKAQGVGGKLHRAKEARLRGESITSYTDLLLQIPDLLIFRGFAG